MSRAAEQRKVVTYALLRGRLVPKTEVVGNESEAAVIPPAAVSLEAEDHAPAVEAVDEEGPPKRRGRPPKQVEPDTAAFEIKD